MANILTTLDGAVVSGSKVRSDDTISETRATANTATNGLMSEANGAAMASAVSNSQFSTASVSVELGMAGSLPVVAETFATGGSGGTTDVITVAGTDVTIDAGESLTITFDPSAPGGAVLATVLTGMGASVSGGSAWRHVRRVA